MTTRPPTPLARVLLADDEPAILRALAGALTRAGFAVTTAEDGAPAIALADTRTFDIVIADLNMRTSGTLVVHHYKRRYGAGVYCAVLSGEDDDATRQACLEVGADEVFVKPSPAAVLRRRLTEVALALRAAAAAHERSA
ncbi:MAG TPA: response regulator [Kofleriaceae bacterium]|nr:response regulator [Kofleriaceae bacterium]